MAQLTIYLDEETLNAVKRAATTEGLSQSQWVASLIKRKTATQWPEHIRNMAGQWTDFPDAKALRDQQPDDTPKESL